MIGVTRKGELPLIERRQFVDTFIDMREARWRDCTFDGCVLIGVPAADLRGCQIDHCLMPTTPADLDRRAEWAPAVKSLLPRPLTFTPPPPRTTS